LVRAVRTRKSAGNNAARDLFKAIKKEGTTQNIIEGFGSAEGLLSTLERGNGNEHSPTTIHLDEINVLASKTDIKGSAGIAIFHKLFDDHDYDRPLANGRGSSVRNAFLSLIGASTLEDFTKTWSVKHEDAGFFSRLLLVGGDVGERRISRPQNPDPEQLTSLVREIHFCISKLREAPLTLRMDLEAQELWDSFHNTFGDGPEWNRIDTYGLRLMVVQAALQEEKSVTKANVQRIIGFLEYEVAVRQVVSPVIADNRTAQMEELIRRYLPEGHTNSKRELQRRTNYQRLGIETFAQAIRNMLMNEEIKIETAGRTTYYTRLAHREDDPFDFLETFDVLGSVIEVRDDNTVST